MRKREKNIRRFTHPNRKGRGTGTRTFSDPNAYHLLKGCHFYEATITGKDMVTFPTPSANVF